MNLKSKKGFTLVELIIVIAILGIIALIAVPSLTNVQANARVNADYNSAYKIGETLRIWLTDCSRDEYTARTNQIKDDWKKLGEIEADLEKYMSSRTDVPQGLTNSFYWVKWVSAQGMIAIAIDTAKPDTVVIETVDGVARYSGDYGYGINSETNVIIPGMVYIEGFGEIPRGKYMF